MIRRREFIAYLSGAAAWPLAVRAQQSAVPVVGFLRDSSFDASTKILGALREGLEEAGYVEGQNVAIEARWSEGDYDQLPKLAAELVQRQVAVILGAGSTAAIAAKAATSIIPIIFSTGDDPIQSGLVSSLNRPEGNVTGVTFPSGFLGVKGVELMHELAPTVTAIGLLVNPNSPAAQDQTREAQAATRTLGLQLDVVNARNESDFDTTFAALQQRGVGALLIPGNSVFTGGRNRLVGLAARHKLPTIYAQNEFVRAGGLMSYGASITGAYRDAGVYIGRILKGAKPSDLPVMQSRKIEFVINLKTAKTLGITFPPSFLVLADEVIE